MLRIITSNRVVDGVVVFLAAAGGWTERVDESLVIVDDEALGRAEATAATAARAAIVIEPYAIEVTRDADGIRPVRYRERIRALGPSIHPDFAKPAGAELPGLSRVA